MFQSNPTAPHPSFKQTKAAPHAPLMTNEASVLDITLLIIAFLTLGISSSLVLKVIGFH